MDAYIVVGCDGSPQSDAALQFAANEAEVRHLPLKVVVAYERTVDPDLDDFDLPDAELQSRARATAHDAITRARIGSADLEVIAQEGEPAKTLLSYADHAFMVVIGSHDRPVLQRLFGHLTSRELLHHSTVPVVIVPSTGTKN